MVVAVGCKLRAAQVLWAVGVLRWWLLLMAYGLGLGLGLGAKADFVTSKFHFATSTFFS